MISVTQKGTIVPEMDTLNENIDLSSALFGKARRAVLALLYTHPDEAYYLRQIARATGVGLGAVQRELKQLSEAAIILRTSRGRHIYYQANSNSPIFPELRSLMVKTAGVGDVLRAALAPLSSRINITLLYGSIARGEDRRGSDVDLLVVGNVTFAEIVSALGPTQEMLGREVNPTVYPPSEFQSKLLAGHHFLKTVMREPRILLIGDEHDLARLAKKQLAH